MDRRITIVDALACGRADDAAGLLFEYMAPTEGEAGRPVPGSIDALPATLRAECADPAAAYPRIDQPFEMVYMRRSVRKLRK